MEILGPPWQGRDYNLQPINKIKTTVLARLLACSKWDIESKRSQIEKKKSVNIKDLKLIIKMSTSFLNLAFLGMYQNIFEEKEKKN